MGNRFSLFGNQLRTVDFQRVTYIGGPHFRFLKHIGEYVWLFNNQFASIDIKNIASIGGEISVGMNPELCFLDCKTLGSCLSNDLHTETINCPQQCFMF